MQPEVTTMRSEMPQERRKELYLLRVPMKTKSFQEIGHCQKRHSRQQPAFSEDFQKEAVQQTSKTGGFIFR